MWRHQTQGWLVLLLLTLGFSMVVDTVTGEDIPSIAEGEDIPSIAEAIELLQIGEIMNLNKRITDKDIEIKKKEEENENLRKKISDHQKERESVRLQHLAEKDPIEKQLKGSKIIVEFMMNVLHHNEEMMRERQSTIAKQAEMVEKAHAENEQCKDKHDDNTKFITESQETIRIQNDNIEILKNILAYTEALNTSYHELEQIKSSDDKCDLPAFVSGMSKILSDQDKEIEDLKTFLENDQELKDHLERIKEEITKEDSRASESDEQWEILKSYQNIINKQSLTIGHLSTIASYGVNMTAAFRYEEDDAGNLVSASSCQCLPEFHNDTQISLVLGSQDQNIVSLWSPWEYQDCFEWKKPDNSTADCGIHGKKVRHRVKELDSVSWEEETEEEACGECKVPELQVGSWSQWSSCISRTNKRTKLEVSGHKVTTVEESRDCIDEHRQCLESYTELSEEWRRISYSSSERYYDNCDRDSGFPTRWYRFILSNSTNMIPTKVAPSQYRDDGKTCGTYTPAWMEGRLPTVGEPPESVTMKFTRGSGSNRDTQSAKVVACQGGEKDPFYLYYLSKPDECDLGYCVTS